jgi:hypothetical protein
MGKNLTKNEKLDLILAELIELKKEIKKLLKHDVADIAEAIKDKPARLRAERSKKAPSRATEPTH